MVEHTTPPALTPKVNALLQGKRIEGKSLRDVLRATFHSRGYIELNESGEVVRSHLRPKGEIPVIAVVAPSLHGLVLVLEVGLHRTTPYKAFEFAAKRSHGTRGKNFPERTRVRKMKDEEFAGVYPVLAYMLEELMMLQRRTWQSKDEWWVPGLAKPVHRGIGIRVRKDDKLLYRQVLLEDIRLRLPMMQKLARSIHFWLRNFKHVDYSDKMLRSNKTAGRIADALSYQVDTPLHLVVAMRRMLGAYGNSKVWNLCEAIMCAHKIKRVPNELCEALHQFLYQHRGCGIPPLKRVRLRIEAERHAKFRHGQGCVTGEVIPTEDLVFEREGVQPLRSNKTTESRLEREAIQQEAICAPADDANDDDVPF